MKIFVVETDNVAAVVVAAVAVAVDRHRMEEWIIELKDARMC